MAQGFLARVAGKTKQIFAITSSAGAADAGKIPALDGAGRLNQSFMPVGIGADTVQGTASEALSAGDFVNFHDDGGIFSVRLADNSNGRQADGYVTASVSLAGAATVYPLDGINSNLSGLTPGARYYLGTAGGVIATPLIETDAGNVGSISQYLGYAKSATELVTNDDGYVEL